MGRGTFLLYIKIYLSLSVVKPTLWIRHPTLPNLCPLQPLPSLYHPHHNPLYKMKRMRIMSAILASASCVAAFDPALFRRRRTTHPARTSTSTSASSASGGAGGGDRRTATKTTATTMTMARAASKKSHFVDALDRPYDLNVGSDARTSLLDDVVLGGGGLVDPGSRMSFATVAPGVWRVVYAPHMTTIAGLFGCELSVRVSSPRMCMFLLFFRKKDSPSGCK